MGVMIRTFVSLWLIVAIAHSLNYVVVDIESPIIISDGDDRTRGNENDDSYFGYSMTFIPDTFGSPTHTQSVDYGTIFIGAPNEKRMTKNSGVAWGCRFSQGAHVSCSLFSRLSEQPGKSSAQCSYHRQLHYPETESNQWIGASLATDGKQLIACAPRWKRNGFYDNACRNESAMTGGCYIAASEREVSIKTPLDQPSQYYYPTYDGDRRIHEYLYLYGEFGFSSHSSTFNHLHIFGAPAARKWTGMYVEYTDDKPNVQNMDGKISSAITANSYLGYAVTSGRTHSTTRPFVAVGAPRARQLYGAVLVSYALSGIPLGILEGDQFGSYFGFALATVDIDGDGYDELLVGAPMHTPDYTLKEYSTGCVFVYKISTLQGNRQPHTYRLCPNSQRGDYGVSPAARFGSAIVKMNDINFDKLEDFAVGAPYDGEDGTGSVFIYYGGYPLSDKPAQIIQGKNFGIGKCRGLGSSLLSDTLDVDKNGTPDLAIGSFECRKVIIVRTRPVAKLQTSISFHTETSRDDRGQISKFLPTQNKFRARVCVKFDFSVDIHHENQLDVWMKFEIDPNLKRFEFSDGEPSQTKYLLSNVDTTCVDRKFVLVQEISENENAKPILFRALLTYNQTKDSGRVESASIKLSPQKRENVQQDEKFENAYNKFNPYYPAPIPTYETEWERLDIAQDDCDRDGNPECNPDLKLNYTITNNNAPYSRGKTLRVGDLENLGLLISLTNQRETAYKPTIKVTFEISDDFEVSKGNMKFEAMQISSKSGQCRTTAQDLSKDSKVLFSHSLRCSILQNGKKLTFSWKVGKLDSIKILKKLNGKIKIRIEAYPETQGSKYTASSQVEIPLEGKFQIEVKPNTPSSGHSEIDPKHNVVELLQLYTLKNTGPSSTAQDVVKAEMIIPTHLTVKGKLTQVIGIADPSALNIRCEAEGSRFYTPGSDLGPNAGSNYSAETVSNSHSRSTRSSSLNSNSKSPPLVSEKTTESGPPEESSTSKLIALTGCRQKSPSCQKVTCYTTLASKESREITLRMYLLRHVVGDLVQKSTTGIRVETSILVSYLSTFIERKGSTMREFASVKGIAAIFYILAVGGGAILFLLVVFALFKCGFFRRKTKDKLKQLKRQTQMLQVDGQDLDLPIVENEVENQDDQDAQEIRDDTTL